MFSFCISVSVLLQPDELTNVLEICNIVFTSMFTLEMILKLTAFGFFEYLRNPYNIFDGIIVIIRSVIKQTQPVIKARLTLQAKKGPNSSFFTHI